MKRFLLILLLASSAPAAAQQLPFRSYSIERGLSESVVNRMMQDSEGYIWIATSYGLNRFDGLDFTNYYEEDGLLSNDIHALYEDRAGRLWIGTENGVNVMEEDSIRTRSVLNPLQGTTVRTIFQDEAGGYWFGTDSHGLWHLDISGTLSQYLVDNGLPDNSVRDIVQDGAGNYWIATRGGLARLRDDTFTNFTVEEGLPEVLLRDLYLDSEGVLWIATRGGLSQYDGSEFRNYTQDEDSLVNDRVQSLSPDGEGGLWVGTEEGVSHMSGGTFTNYSVDQGLTNNIVHATLLDREQNIWFGTFGGGITAFLGDHIRNFTVENGLPNNVITSITQDNLGEHWVTTYGGGLAHYEDQRFVTYNEFHGLVDNKVYTAELSDQNDLLIGTRWGLSIYNGIVFYNYDEDRLPSRKIRTIHNPSRGEGFWLGTYGDGLLHYDDEQFQSYTTEDGLANNTVMDITEDNRGRLWFATYGGVSMLEEGGYTNYTLAEGLPNNGVMDALRAENGDMWFSTHEGIARISDGEIMAVTTGDGLPDEVCYFILQDEQGYFWIGTNRGVVRFDAERYSEDQTLAEKRKAFKLITQDQGLVANEMNASAGYTDDRGMLWFGSVGGLTRLDPSGVQINSTPPKVHVEAVSVSGESVRGVDNLQIGSDNHTISFHFIGLNFTAPEQVVYEYRIRNADNVWRRTTQRQVQLSTYLPGSYEFEVRAQNEDGIWSAETATVSFTVLAPFWMQWWFVMLAALVFAGAFYFIYHYYRTRKLVEIERMRVRIASDLHDDVGSALTEIALQSDFLQTLDVREGLKESLHQIGEQSRKIVTSLDDIVWSIDARNDTLGDLTDRMQDYINNVLPDREVHYEFGDLDMDKILDVPVKENLYLIFKEAVNNVAKHSDADRVTVRLVNKGSGSFDLVVRDNGSISNHKRKSGQGMRNMKMRANRIGADIEFTNTEGFTVHVSGEQS
ncbi:MAG: two-component regulator propeller domain-containing protein [Balneolaceae bacterium]|nr:two-component regulator propeller domain-containing protein [Balneolaceae bacterium]